MQEITQADHESLVTALDNIDTSMKLRTYSGRGMYGKVCFGITGSISEFANFLVSLTMVNEDLAVELTRQGISTDNMGYDTIFYFTGYSDAFIGVDEDEFV